MPIDHFALTRGDDAAERPCAAQPVGTSESLSAAEPVGVLGGHPAPAPAAAGPEPTSPDADDEPDLGGARLAQGRPAMGSGSGEGSASAPARASGPITPGAVPGSGGGGYQFESLGLGEAVMERFVSDYLKMLDGRLETIRHCLADSDIEGARVAVLSLESSSLMLGGNPLATRLGELRAQLDLGPTPQRNALLALVEVAASVFRRDLQATGLG